MSSTVAYLTHIAAWLLLQFIWQSFLIILSWMVCARLFQSSAAGLRYRLASLHFLVLGALPLLTLGASQWAIIVKKNAAGLAGGPLSFGNNAPLFSLLAGYHLLVRAIPLLALTWTVGVAAMMFCLVNSWLALRQIEFAKASIGLTALAHQLAYELAIAAPLILHADVSAPFVSGARRPKIVLPFVIERDLSPDQLRVILAHELVHIGHADYVWNLFQRILLALLWFHPVAWILYSRLLQEREIRCDAVAASKCGCASDLAHGLVRLTETAIARRSTVALSSMEGHLETRIRALLQSQASSNFRVRLVAPVSAMLFVSVLAIWTGERCLADEYLRGLYVASVFGPVITMHARDDAGSFDLQMQHGRVLRLVVAEQVVPRSRILQAGENVTAISESGRPLISLQLDPRGEIHWSPRYR